MSELMTFAEELGLGPHAATIAELAKPSWRLIPSDDHARPAPARIWGDLVASMRLAAIDAATCHAAGLDQRGGFQARFDATPALEGAWPPVRCDVTFDAAEPSVPAEGAGAPATVHRELVLPRAWSALVRPLGLSPAERESWETLRARLAGAQGTEVPQDEWQAVHRFFGYPDERQGLMPEICERASAARIPAHRWVLVLQVTLEPVPSVPSLSIPRRAYLWADEHAVRAGDLSRAAEMIVQ